MRDYHKNVFINCPFDDAYKGIMHAIVFAIHDCGFYSRSALEANNSAEVRIEKIQKLIKESRYGIHDISRIELSQNSNLPRFNMPLELGIFMGAKSFGPGNHKLKNCMILDAEPYRYQRFMSDIAGQDIHSHEDKPTTALKKVRNWLANQCLVESIKVPGEDAMADRYNSFSVQLPVICEKLALKREKLLFSEYRLLVSEWLLAYPEQTPPQG